MPNACLIGGGEHRRMQDTQRLQDVTEVIRAPRGGAAEVVGVLLLVQGAILVATAIEALFWSLAFPGAGGGPFLLSASAAVALLVARARLRPERSWSRRAVLVVEGVILVSLGIDASLAVFITHAAPPAVAIATRLIIPVAVIALLRSEVRA